APSAPPAAEAPPAPAAASAPAAPPAAPRRPAPPGRAPAPPRVREPAPAYEAPPAYGPAGGPAADPLHDPREAGSVPPPSATGALIVDRRTRQVWVGERAVILTPKEFDLLALLTEDPGAVYSRQQILDRVWDPNFHGPTKTLDVHVATLRRKLGNPAWIQTLRGVGLRLAVRTEPHEEHQGPAGAEHAFDHPGSRF
ncbi:winged helix-turn-helix domain-containing protein, partial [Streptomyces sp. NPDC127033]|uniref:winged helix-turn-helix domain-containing protein n=1 Tax=Streptomyces sp. NPDC127033 TaxID=3347110 RepID=UPI003650DFB8